MAEATKGLGLSFLFIQLPQPNERHYENIDCAVCQKTDWRFPMNIDVATLERNKFRPNVNSEKGALKQMHLGKHQRTDEGRFRRERADSLVKNLKKEYPALHDVNGNMKLGTLRDKLGVDSLNQALKKLGRR